MRKTRRCRFCGKKLPAHRWFFCSPEHADDYVDKWWDELETMGADGELSIDIPMAIISHCVGCKEKCKIYRYDTHEAQADDVRIYCKRNNFYGGC
jgi:hypothetical protein